MAETTIVGVDFSGAKADKATWITESKLTVEDRRLAILSCDPIKRKDLTNKLASENFTVAGIDFPFSVPFGFAKEFASDSFQMPEMWKLVDRMTYKDFKNKRNIYVAGRANGKLHLRASDVYWPRALSCLQTGGPNMLPMTFRGMQMLCALRESGCLVPPIDDEKQSERVLLETMPGTALGSFRLRNTLYKNGTGAEDRRNRRNNRIEILNGLKNHKIVGLNLDISQCLEEKCVNNTGGDALDSLVAAIVAARWHINPADCRRPGDGSRGEGNSFSDRLYRLSLPMDDLDELQTRELELAKIEGWIYAPYPVLK